MNGAAAHPVFVRPAPEITTKGAHARQQFHDALAHNLAEALTRQGIEHRLGATVGRLLIHTEATTGACEAAARVFGVGSVSPVRACAAAEIDAMACAAVATFGAEVRGRRYAVRARRRGRHPFGSLDVERALGAALGAQAGAKVDLKSPELTVRVEILGEHAHLFTEKLPGPGGLPTGVQGRALALMSGGFDSAVAAWRMMKRGVAVDYLLCNLDGAADERLVLQVTRLLCERWCFGHRPTLHVVDFAPLLAALRARVGSGHWQLVLKRLMYRTGAHVARALGAHALVTGESVGQVSSQTLQNLAALDGSVDVPVLRPLLGYDKQEIIDLARHVGTAALSARVREHCALGAGQPVTAARRHRLDAEDAKIRDAEIAAAVAAERHIDVLATGTYATDRPYLFVRAVPPGAVLIDCQPTHLYRRLHADGALHRPAAELLETFRELDRNRTYVLYCANGAQAGTLSAVMQQAGYEAYAFEGGVRAIRRCLAAR